jgi:hypothetical protein
MIVPGAGIAAIPPRLIIDVDSVDPLLNVILPSAPALPLPPITTFVVTER